jgi:AbrB family looped-hinge helix DNA binding protein
VGKLTKLTHGGQVTLPKEIRDKVGMEPGDYVEIELGEDGHIVMTPKKLVDASQAYFWSEAWQRGERKADEDIKAGRVKKFRSADEALTHLEREG